MLTGVFGLVFLLLLGVSDVLAKTESNPEVGTYVIGIDLGTTYSCVGVFRNGRVEIIQNENGNRITPSYVAFAKDGERLIGDPAKNQLTSNPENTIYDAKRLIGRLFNDENVQKDMLHWPFKVVSVDTRPYVSVSVQGKIKKFSAEEISSMVLIKMKEMAEKYLETEIKDAVITVPAYFNDQQRQATKDAGRIAGLNVLRIINEPTAAAIAYGFNKKGEKNVLVYDLGGGTFDVSLLSIENGVFEVLSTAGDTHLGGEDFDNTVMKFFVDTIEKKYKISLKGKTRELQMIKREAEKAKRYLSRHHQTEVEFFDLTGDDTTIEIKFTRAQFEELNMHYFKSTLTLIDRVLNDAGMDMKSVHEVVLVGGSTRIPKVQSLVKEHFKGKEPNKGINPDEAVAFGAAIQAAIIKGYEETQDLVLLDVIPLSLGIETQGGIMTKIVDRNSRIPSRRSQIFSTVRDNQEMVEIAIFEGERHMVKDNHHLGRFTLGGIDPAPAGVPQIEVTFDIDQNGILHVTAHDKKTGKKNDIKITNEKDRLSQEEIEKMIKDAEQYAEDDKLIKEKIEKKVAFEQIIYRVKSKVSNKEEVKDKLSEEEIDVATKACDEATTWIEKNPEATATEMAEKQKEFEEKVKDILTKIAPSQPPPSGSESPKEDEHEEL